MTTSKNDGYTGLANDGQISKTNLRIDSIGDVEELNATIGLALTKLSPMTIGVISLREVQHRLCALGGELSNPGKEHFVITSEDVGCIEQIAGVVNETLYPLKDVLIPGGSQAAARLHFARAVCRRAERTMWKFAESTNGSGIYDGAYIYGSVNPESIQYLNRLSTFLFVMARKANKEDLVVWDQKGVKQSQSQ